MTKVARVLSDMRLSASDIAKKTRIPIEQVQRILDGAHVSLEDLRALSRGLRVPLQNFSERKDVDSQLSLLFRTSTSSRTDIGAEAACTFVTNALRILPPLTQRAEWLSSFGFREETAEEAIRIANEFRLKFLPGQEDEPLLHLPELLVSLGGLVVGRLETSRFEGASVIADNYAFIFVSPRIPARMLFTVAHELGHLIAHHAAKEAVTLDLATQIGGYRYSNKSERFVDLFASELLLPARGVARALLQIKNTIKASEDNLGDIEIIYLARIFGVSFEAAARRCEALELLPSGGAYSLIDSVKKKFKSAEIRANALGIPKQPTARIPSASSNLLNSAIAKIEQGEVSLGWVTDKFGLTANEVYAGRVSASRFDGTRH